MKTLFPSALCHVSSTVYCFARPDCIELFRASPRRDTLYSDRNVYRRAFDFFEISLERAKIKGGKGTHEPFYELTQKSLFLFTKHHSTSATALKLPSRS